MTEDALTIFFPDAYAGLGGSHISTFDIIEHLPAQQDGIGINAFFVSPDESAAFLEAKSRRLPTVAMQTPPFASWKDLWWGVRYTREAIKLLKSYQVDIVHCTNQTLLYWQIPCKLLGIPLIWNVRSIMPDDLKVKIRQRIYLTTVRNIIYVSKAAEGAVHKLGVPDGLFERTIHNFSPKKLIAETFTTPQSEDRVRIGWVGRLLDPVKDAQRAIHIVSQLPTDAKYSFTYFGECGPDLAEDLVRSVPETVRSRVQFAGPRETSELFKSIDVLLVTSVLEGSPRVIMEAGLHGIPSVAHAVGGIPELIVDEVSGYLFTTDASAAERLSLLIGSRARRKNMGAAAFDFFSKNRSWAKIIPEYIAYYKAVVGK